ncbi:aspartate-semialdehyde dehydrogenase [Paludibaculum fermentans]|uniref:aspartate-semialdehyde dehydrogenase n=1 Tax=Paludibaculum fermentans TaxID=1473598 RepID=A0A7S7SJ61_PALFE|nr:aspartate-semialdehyde dehydrogenase [Paludibaculum fermentans]QOY87742.1 aspartate-semialdehyde dehydrogenase [Paludibaculum fermentans]
MNKKIEVGVLGATGMVGQSFVKFLEGHPWFELTWAGASDRSAGKKYADATSWRLDGSMPERVAALTVSDCKPGNGAPKLMFSAMDASVATEIERAFAEAGHLVVSNSKNHRMELDVPLLVPEINPDHLQLLAAQKSRGWKGAIATNPNCSTVALTMGLAPLMPFGIQTIIATTMQAISGAGYPGVPSLDILGNVIPFIGGEEAKMEIETQKIMGTFAGDHIQPLPAKMSAHCNRVPVVDGHTVTVSVGLRDKASLAEILAAYQNYTSVPQQRNLPSAPKKPVLYLPEENRPQPRRDAFRENGMCVTVGRLRECPVLDYKFVCLGHNTIRGAAGAAVLNAELMYSEGLLD